MKIGVRENVEGAGREELIVRSNRSLPPARRRGSFPEPRPDRFGRRPPCALAHEDRKTFGCSRRSRLPAPWPMRSMVMAGVSIHSLTTVVRMAAPVGVVSSASIVDAAERHALEQLGRRREPAPA